MPTEWEVVEVTESTEPPRSRCPLKPQDHTWSLSIEGGELAFGSGCMDCDQDVEIESLFLNEIQGTVTFVPAHEGLGGWHGLNRCDCGWAWDFTPLPPIDQLRTGGEGD